MASTSSLPASLQPGSLLRNALGLGIALLVIGSWFAMIAFLLSAWTFDFANPLTWVLMLVQTHLFTGLFITAHDSMHGTVHSNRFLNRFIGILCAGLFAFNYYPVLLRKHKVHHSHPGTGEDPDYHHGSFWPWYLKFLREYVTVWQVLLAAGFYNLLIHVFHFPEMNVLFFWAIPAGLSTLQLFFFGTYLPHRGEHDNRHNARSQGKNHLWAFVSCYFFGYHFEHHDSPATPWWLLYKKK